jgi:hypothetical protein
MYLKDAEKNEFAAAREEAIQLGAEAGRAQDWDSQHFELHRVRGDQLLARRGEGLYQLRLPSPAT